MSLVSLALHIQVSASCYLEVLKTCNNTIYNLHIIQNFAVYRKPIQLHLSNTEEFF